MERTLLAQDFLTGLGSDSSDRHSSSADPGSYSCCPLASALPSPGTGNDWELVHHCLLLHPRRAAKAAPERRSRTNRRSALRPCRKRP